jgi:hypothetical protein
MEGKAMALQGNNAIDLLECRVVVPDHVVRREFAAETVILNLKTGIYHGLNQTAGRMLDELERTGTVSAAAQGLTREYGLPVEEIRDDLLTLCQQMLERQLIEVSTAADA